MPHTDTDTFAARIAPFLGVFRAHPIAVSVSAAALALGVSAIVVGWTVTAPSKASGGPPPPLPRRGGQLTSGSLSLEASDSQGRFIAVAGDVTTLAEADTAEARRAATFVLMPGLADEGCFTFRAADGRFLRDMSGLLGVSAVEQTTEFRRETTFCVRGGIERGSATLEALGQRGKLVRHVGDEMRVERSDERGSTFLVRAPLA